MICIVTFVKSFCGKDFNAVLDKLADILFVRKHLNVKHIKCFIKNFFSCSSVLPFDCSFQKIPYMLSRIKEIKNNNLDKTTLLLI